MRMMRDCEKGKIDLILTKSVARFARNTVDSLNYVRRLKAKGIGVYFEEQALDSLKTENEMALGLYSVLAQAESENISANVRWVFVNVLPPFSAILLLVKEIARSLLPKKLV